ncbi:MAG: DNA-processing protein DprA [Paludibacter sp.]|nr:DNA-processing protein DprA [Paludibacter sp.]
MNLDTLKFCIGITLINGIGNNLAKNLIAYLGSEEAVFKEKKKVLSKVPGIGNILAHEIVNHRHVLQRAEQEIEFIIKNNIQCYYFADKDYPFRLKECSDAPLVLYAKCSHNLNDARFLSIVGTRKATEYGKRICKKFINELSAVSNLVIISGLAYGIDIYAHKTALESGIPTIGVVAHGLDRIYPESHRSVAVKMLQHGGIVTEYLSKTNPDRQNFVQRNRIIAGLSDAVVVVESAIKGGALITADLANDYNRDVFAFPGRTDDEWSAGCNALIKTNRASLIDSTGDFLKSMGWENKLITDSSFRQQELFVELNEDEQYIYSAIRKYPEGIQVNQLAIETAIPYSKLTAILLQMEFKMLLKCLPGSIYKAMNRV